MIPDGKHIPSLTGDELENARACIHEAGHALVSEYVELPRVSSVRVAHGGGETWIPHDDGYIRPSERIAVLVAGLVAEEWLHLPDAGERGCEHDWALAREIGKEWDGTIGGPTWQHGRNLATQAMRRGVGAALVHFATLLDRRGYLKGPELDRAIDSAMQIANQSTWTPDRKRMHEAREKRALDMVPVRAELYERMVVSGVLGAMGVRDAWKEAGRMATEYLADGTPPAIPREYPEAPPRPQRRVRASVEFMAAKGART